MKKKPKKKKPSKSSEPAQPAEPKSQKKTPTKPAAQPAAAPATQPQISEEDKKAFIQIGEALGLPQMAKAIQQLHKRVTNLETQPEKSEGGNFIKDLLKGVDIQKLIDKFIGGESSEAQPNVEKEILDKAVAAATEEKKARTQALYNLSNLLEKGYHGYINPAGEVVISQKEPEKE